ncbi:MAG: PASTA domain-containing protein [Bacteroidota bacterium]
MLKYFISREFLYTLGALFVGGILVYLAIFFLILPLYTRHGAGITIPDVQEMALGSAEDALDDVKLRPQVSDSVYVEGLEPGTVIKQYPAPYTRVKPGRLVSLTINQRQAPMVIVPDLKDMILYQAKVQLEGVKLGLGKITYVPKLGKDKLLSYAYKGQQLKPGDRVPLGSKIDVVVKQGVGSKMVVVPDLIGLNYEDAVNLIQSIGLNLVPNYRAGGEPEEQGLIYRQVPKAEYGESLNVGSSVDVFIYGEAPESRE